jgi:DNA replication protein DnaC
MKSMEKTNECPTCKGTGWKTVEVEATRLVKRCECFEKSRQDRQVGSAQIPARYEGCSFENFTPLNEKLSLAKTMAVRFVDDYPIVDCGLLILGPCGVGKTHLAVSILKALIYKNGINGLFYDFRDLLKRIQHSFNPESQSTEMEVLSPVLGAEVLVLDDLGAERPTEWVRDTIAYILNSRYNLKLTTLITSNFEDHPREMSTLADGTRLPKEETLEDRIGSRLRSRLYEMCKVLRLEGDDFRVRVKQAQYQF